MREANVRESGSPSLGIIVGGFCITIILCILAAILFFRTGHPFMPMKPQPKNNKGMLSQPVSRPESPRAKA